MENDRNKGARRGWYQYIAMGLAVAAGMPFAPDLVFAQSPRDVKLLRPREVTRLSAQAREEYDKGVAALDHVKPVLAIKHFNQSSRIAPQAIDLHFLTARLAHLRARIVFGLDESRSRDLAEDYYDIAELALRRVGKLEDLTPLTKRRYDTQLKMIVEEKKGLKVRDQQRKAVGETFRKIYAKERYGDPEEQEAKEKKRKELAAKRAAERRNRPPGGAARGGRGGRARRGGGGSDAES